MKTNSNYQNKVNDLVSQLHEGCFLVSNNEKEINVMTIGCALIGYMWQRPMAMVLVRGTRHTKELLESSDVFTINIPKKFEMLRELEICGKASGRKVDKFEKCNFKTASTDSGAIYITGCKTVLECNIVYKQIVTSSNLRSDILNNIYSNEDYHTLYFAEITRII